MTNPFTQIIEDTRAHLLAQGRPAMNYGGSCMYRMPNDNGGSYLRCAAGLHIPDEMHHERDEGDPIEELLHRRPELLVHIANKYKLDTAKAQELPGLLRKMQSIHDYAADMCVRGWCMWPEMINQDFDTLKDKYA